MGSSQCRHPASTRKKLVAGKEIKVTSPVVSWAMLGPELQLKGRPVPWESHTHDTQGQCLPKTEAEQEPCLWLLSL